MKKVYFVQLLTGVLFILLALHCKKEHHYMNNGVITGFDVRMCACCGGLMINFEDSTKPYTGHSYLINNEPSSLGITEKTQFPFYVKVDWKLGTRNCGGPHIDILNIAPR